jgi:RNA polymerase sigma factor (sigma-70 family)
MEAIETLVAGKTKAVQPVEKLYEQTFPAVAGFVRTMGGNRDDAKDIFHDALVVYYEMAPDNNIRTSAEAYIVGIAKHLWIRKYHRSRHDVGLSELEHRIAVPDDYYPSVNQKRLLRYVETAGKNCMNLLRAFYYQKLPMKELVKTLGYSNEHSASAQKYKCLEKIRDSIKDKQLAYEDFVE